jgi:hypothetical protein
MSTPDHPDAPGHSQSLARPDGLPAPAVHKPAPPRTHGALPSHEVHAPANPSVPGAPVAAAAAVPRVETAVPRPSAPRVPRSPAAAAAQEPWTDPFPAWRLKPRPFHEAFRVLPTLIDGRPVNPLRGWRWKIPLNPFRRRRPAAA